MADKATANWPPEPRSSRHRPRLARLLDRVALPLTGLLGRLISRLSEDLLAKLAAADRPGLRMPPEALAGLARAEAHIASGRAAFQAGQHAEALHHFSQATERAPDSAWAWHGRGDALQLLGQPEFALSAYDRAVALAPETGLHHAGRSNALMALGRAAEAEAALSVALARDPALTWVQTRRTSG